VIPAWARRTIVEPLWTRVSGSPRLAEWRELEGTQYLPLDVLRDRQDARLRELVAKVCRDTPFYGRRYAEAGVAPADVTSVTDLTRLPIVTKQDIRSHAAEFRSTAVHSWPVMEFRTGGSTGVPLILWATEEVSERRNAAARRADRWTGWEVGEPVAAVWGNPKLPTTLKERLRHELLEPMMFLDTMELTRESVAEFARRWRGFRPTLLFGHAHSIYLLACSLRDLGIDTIRPKGD
jgi:phenylacetate-CoA ligase